MICSHIRRESRMFRGDSALGPQSQLLALALSCRAWFSVAIDYLWYKLEDFTPLVRAMPEDLWEVREVSAHEQMIVSTTVMDFHFLLVS